MSRTLRYLAGSGVALLLFLPSISGASVVNGEHGETFIDPVFAEEPLAQTEFSVRVVMDRFATSYKVVRLRSGSQGPAMYYDKDGILRFDWEENTVERPLQSQLEVAAEYAFTENFSMEIRVPLIFDGADRWFSGPHYHSPRIVSRYHNIAEDPAPGDDSVGALAIEQDEYTTELLQLDPIWLTFKGTIYAARSETYSNVLTAGLSMGFLFWGQRQPREYYIAHEEMLDPANTPDNSDDDIEVKWFDYRDSGVVFINPYLSFQRSYGDWQMGGMFGVQLNVFTDRYQMTTLDMILGLNASYMVTEYLATVIEFIGQMDLYTEPALWGFAPGLRVILPFTEGTNPVQFNGGLGLLLPVYDESQTDPYNPAIRLTLGIEL